MVRRTIQALHGALVRLLLPAGFREEFGDELQETFARRLAATDGTFTAVGLGIREALDLLRTSVREWAAAVGPGMEPGARGPDRAGLPGGYTNPTGAGVLSLRGSSGLRSGASRAAPVWHWG